VIASTTHPPLYGINFPDAVVVGGRHHAIHGAILLTDSNLPHSCSPSSQNVNPMHPEEIRLKHLATRHRASPVFSFQKDAKGAELCASIPGVMNAVNQRSCVQGLLEKKRGKALQRVREQLTRASQALANAAIARVVAHQRKI
jgi:hypothetical protein